MDPLSVTASVLAVLTAAKASLKKARDCREATQELESLTIEIDRVYSIVRSVSAYLNANSNAPANIELIEPVKCILSKIEHIEAIALPTRSVQKLSKSNQQRITWVLKKRRLIALRDELRVIRSDLVLQFSLIESTRLSCFESLLAKVVSLENTLKVDQRTESLEHGAHTSFYLSSKTNSGEDKSLQSLNNSENKSTLVRQDQRITSLSCMPWCSCICHSQNVYTSPPALRWILGDFRLRYWQTRPHCNERSCHRSGATTISAEIHLPAYLMRHYMVLRMSNSILGGPQFSLKLPRVMGWSHLLWNYAGSRRKDAILRLFAERTATPADVNHLGSNALIYTVDDLDLTTLLIHEKADPYIGNSWGRTAAELLWERAFAGLYGSEGPYKVSILLQDQEYIDVQGFSVIHKIVLGLNTKDLRAELEISTAYLDAGDFRNRTPLCWASMRNDAEAVQTLLDFGASPNIKDDLGHTCLDWLQGSKVCRLLLEANVDVSSRNRAHGRSALHLFCGRGNPTHKDSSEDAEVIDLLIDAGIDVNGRDWHEETPLHRAIFTGRSETAKTLLARGADPNITNAHARFNAMHIAVAYDCFAIIPALLASGVDYTAVSNSGQTIAHHAARSASTRTVQVLTDAKLVGLNLDLRDRLGSTATDEITKRESLQETELGIHEAFEIFAGSIAAYQVGARQDSVVEEVNTVDSETHSTISQIFRLPGSFPE